MGYVPSPEGSEKYPPHESLIYFIEREGLRWWDYLFTRTGFRHCFMFQWDEWSQRYLCIDWRNAQTDLIILYDFEVDHWMKAAYQEKVTVVRFWREYGTLDVFPIRYCSNVLARYLGLGNRTIMTPYRLYRTLLKAGGEVVYSWRQSDGQQNPETLTGANQAREDADRAGQAADG